MLIRRWRRGLLFPAAMDYAQLLKLTCDWTVLGEIDLDPAAHRAAQKVVRAKQFFTLKNDGLTKEWKDLVAGQVDIDILQTQRGHIQND